MSVAQLPVPASVPVAAGSQTVLFVPQAPGPRVKALRIGAAVSVVVLFLVVLPLLNQMGIVRDVSVNVLGRYLCFAIVALGVDLIWGFGGILSLCQALFFCLGGYAVGMFLSLPQGGGQVQKVYNNIPQFFFFSNRTTLPAFWKPFASFPFALLVGLALPACCAAIFGFFIFRSRVRGVYFAIITQALAWAAYLLFCRSELLLGATDGLNNFYPPLNHSHRWILGLYLLTAVVLVAAYIFCHMLTHSRFGRVLVAIRDKELRLNFAGYKPYAFKVFAFATAAVLAAIGGMLYVPQNGIVTPEMMSVSASISIVVWVAVGGRGRLWGAILGALIVRYAYSMLTNDVPTAWPFVEGGLFVAVVLFFPDGFVGLWDSLENRVARHASIFSILLVAAPLLIIGGFVLLEALGLVPRVLNHPISTGLSAMPVVQVKYLVLVGALALTAGVKWALIKLGQWDRDSPAPSTAYPGGQPV